MAVEAQIYGENYGLQWWGSQEWMMENHVNDCGGLLYDHHLHPQNHQFPVYSNELLFSPPENRAAAAAATTAIAVATGNGNRASNGSQSLAAHLLQKESQDINRFISLQNEKLRVALHSQNKQQAASIIRKLEAESMILMRQKDEEIAKARKRKTELDELVRKLETENQKWHKIAAEREAMAVNLNNKLEEIKERNSTTNNEADDAESCCEDHENNTRETYYKVKNDGKIVCRRCKCRDSTVLILPCRHLCSCKACESLLESCPLCNSPKKATIQALFCYGVEVNELVHVM